MQYIVKNSSNQLVFTLKEKQTLTNPNWLFELTSRETNSKKYFIAVDSSQYPDRINQFTIIENTTEIPLSGQIKLISVGEYYYRILEQSSSTNLNPALSTSVCEEGIIIVQDSAQVDFQNNITETYIIHQPS